MEQQAHKSVNGQIFPNEEMALFAVAEALEKKATCPVILDLKESVSFTDYFVIVSASNPRQAYAIAESVRMYFKRHFEFFPMSIDGLDSSTWILLDYGFMFVHVFVETSREVYGLERLWSKAPMVPISEEHLEKLLKKITA